MIIGTYRIFSLRISITIGKTNRDRNILPAPVMIATLPASRGPPIPGQHRE
jgi:hypothetical protein